MIVLLLLVVAFAVASKDCHKHDALAAAKDEAHQHEAKKAFLAQHLEEMRARRRAMELGDAANESAVQQLHLSMTGAGDVAVMWVNFAQTPSPACTFDTASPPRAHVARAVVTRYGNETLLGWTGYIYTAHFASLQPRTRYYYRCATSDVYSFVSPIAAGSETPFTIAVFGDSGTSPGGGVFGPVTSRHLYERRDQYDFLWELGDLCYSFGIQQLWDQLGRQNAPIMREKIWMNAVGNHESWWNFTAYRHRFTQPSAASRSGSPFYFSFDYGLVHFVSMSSEHPHGPGSAQYAWIAADLASVDRARTPWLVVGLHKPMYCSNTYVSCSGWAGGMRRDLERVFNKHRVNLVLFGHVHAMEVSRPVRDCEVVGSYAAPGAPVYGLLGMGGAIFDGDYWTMPAPAWSAYRDSKHFGFSTLTFHNKSTVSFNYYVNANMAVNRSEVPIHSFILNNWALL